MPNLFEIDVEATLTGGNEWTGTVVGANQSLVRDTDSGLYGSVAGAKLTIGGTADVYAYKDFSINATSAAALRFALSGLASLTVSSGTPGHNILRLMQSGSARSWIEWRYTGSNYTLQLHMLDDSFVTHSTAQYTLDESVDYVQVKYEKSSADNNTDAAFSLYFNDTLKERKTGLEVWALWNVWTQLRIGAFSTIDSVTSGSWIFDKVLMNDTGDLPGSPNVDPVVDAGADQSGTLGESHVVTTVSFSDDNAVECNLTCDAGGTITVVPNGNAVVTGNGTNAVNITGTNAEILATIDSTNGITLNRSQVTWDDPANPPPAGHVEYNDTILVEVIDSGGLSHSDGFVMAWEMDTGNNTSGLKLEDPTLAGINSKIDLAYIIPTPGTEYVETVYLEITDGNGNVDWKLVPITVSALKSGAHKVLSGVGGGVLQGVL